MKTFKELFAEIVTSDELKKAYEEAVKAGSVEAFLKEQGCEATVEDVVNFFKEQSAAAELSEEEMKAVAGGFHDDGGCIIVPGMSTMTPWSCNPKYSSIFDRDSFINPSLICA